VSFDNPRFLGLLLLLIPLALGMIFHYRKRKKGAELFASSAQAGERERKIREFRFRMIWGDFFFLVFTASLIVALAGPRWGVHFTADYRRGVDVILAFDISRSMQVRDAGGGESSRLDQGLRIARNLASGLGGGFRMGTAAGKGRGVLAVPLTYDSEAVLNFLDSLDDFSLTGTGTNLESLVDAAAGAFRDDSPGRREIILFTDGESLSGSPEGALSRARNRNITLSAIGLGSDEGGPVPSAPGSAEKTPEGFLLSGSGAPVHSTRRGELLKTWAEKSGGIYVDGGRNDAAFVAADYIRSLSAESGLIGHRRESRPRWRLFVLAALVSLGLSRFLAFGRGRALLAACVFSLLGSSCSGMQGKLFIMEGNFFNSRGMYTEAIASYLRALDYDDSAPYGEYGLGSSYFALEEGSAALDRYGAAEQELRESNRANHHELLYRINYNSGIIHFEEGDYTGAAEAFRKALEIDGGRIEAKRNLELSLLTLSRNAAPQPAASSLDSGGGSEGGDVGSSAVFEYLRRKEQDQWKSREQQTEEDPAGLDY
jgi:Ca-activated chloride channel family protein